MNISMVDVTGVRGVTAGDEVVLIGSQGSKIVNVEELAATLGTINYEIATRINPQLPRILT